VQKNTGRLNLGFVLFGGLALLGSAGCLDSGSDAGEDLDDKATFPNKVVLDWSTHTRSALVTATNNLDPLVATRTLAMVHLAMHDAINAADRQYQPYTFTTRDSSAHPVAAAASAAHRVLVNLFPAQAADLDAKFTASLADVPDGLGETRGVALGDQAANALLQRRANDGSANALGYAPSSGPGKYQFVPPLDFVIHPEWRFVTPFALSSPSALRNTVAPPPALNSNAYRDAFNEVKAAGIKTGSNRTAEQTAYAKFWEENSDIGWNTITRTVVISKGLSLHRSARLFALVNMAMADGFIAGWDAKFFYDFWRPFTAVRGAANDNNNSTTADPAWEALLFTPPVQDHPSTHSILGEAAATVLGRVIGDRTTFSFTSSTAENPTLPRTYTRFSAASNENGDSRVRGGLHFRFAVNEGLEMGDDIGDYVVDNFLEPTF
jgi:hypothetical protein